MSIPALIEKGIDVFAYVPGQDTPLGEYKKIIKPWKDIPRLDEAHTERDNINYAIRPDYKWVDIDFDDAITRNLSFSFFNGCFSFGRDTRGHVIQEIINPTAFTRIQVKFDDKVLIEMRGKNNYSIAKGILDENDRADISVNEHARAYTYSECRQAVFKLGLIAQLIKGYSGSVNDYLIPIVGEMGFKGVLIEDVKEIFAYVLAGINREERLNETNMQIHAIYKAQKYSKLEKLDWSDRNVDAVRNSIEEIAQDIKIERQKPTLEFTTLETIMSTEYEPIEEIVKGMLTPGLWFLASKPKLGKSFLAFQVAHAVATGAKFFEREVIQGSVLYIALEDNAQRIKSRAEITGLTKCKNIHFAFTSPKFNEGFEIQVMKAIEDIGDVKLVVIDTFIRAKSSKKFGGNDAYEEGSFLIDRLQREMLAHKVCCLCLTHDRKSDEKKTDDRINRMIGTTAYQGQDGNWRLDRTRGIGKDDDTVFTIVARDLPEQEYAIKLNQGTWSMIGVAEKGEVHDKLTRNILDVVKLLQEEGGDAKLKEIIAKMRECNFIEPTPDKNKLLYERGQYNTTYKVRAMKKKGLLIKGDRTASYKIPEIIPEEPPQEDLPF